MCVFPYMYVIKKLYFGEYFLTPCHLSQEPKSKSVPRRDVQTYEEKGLWKT